VRISSIHGEASWHAGRLIVPMYHPAAALHQPNLKSVIAHDFSRLKELIEKEKLRRAEKMAQVEKEEDNAAQLSLF
jgi:DNA polymerase